MKLWLLRPVTGLKENDNPWEPWYNKSFGFVVRSETEEKARLLAHTNAGNENHGFFLGNKISNTNEPWNDPNYSSCVELLSEGNAEVVMMDFSRD